MQLGLFGALIACGSPDPETSDPTTPSSPTTSDEVEVPMVQAIVNAYDDGSGEVFGATWFSFFDPAEVPDLTTPGASTVADDTCEVISFTLPTTTPTSSGSSSTVTASTRGTTFDGAVGLLTLDGVPVDPALVPWTPGASIGVSSDGGDRLPAFDVYDVAVLPEIPTPAVLTDPGDGTRTVTWPVSATPESEWMVAWIFGATGIGYCPLTDDGAFTFDASVVSGVGAGVQVELSRGSEGTVDEDGFVVYAAGFGTAPAQ